MQLFVSATSPYVRQCRIMVREKALEARVAERSIGPDPLADAAYLAVNPAGHGPALATPEGLALIGAPLICDYLDSQGEGPVLCRQDDWAARRRQALADAATGFAVALKGGPGRPPPNAGSQAWSDALARVLDALEALQMQPAPFSIGLIAAGAALAYLDLRLPALAWRDARPRLAALHAELERRPSFQATRAP